jgi:hypothetical protein
VTLGPLLLAKVGVKKIDTLDRFIIYQILGIKENH